MAESIFFCHKTKIFDDPNVHACDNGSKCLGPNPWPIYTDLLVLPLI